MNNEQFSDDDWLTPPDLIKKFGHFDLDPAMPVIQPWKTADKHYTKADDGLVQQWSGRIWLNPPYSDMESWIKRLMEHVKANGTGMSLVNARTETQWFFDGIWNLADAVFFPERRFRFFRPDGASAATGRIGSAIAAYSHEDAQILYTADLDGKFIVLKFRMPPDIKLTWRRIIRAAVKQLGPIVTTEQLYDILNDHPRCQSRHWKDKVRQVLHEQGRRLGPGQWELIFE